VLTSNGSFFLQIHKQLNLKCIRSIHTREKCFKMMELVSCLQSQRLPIEDICNFDCLIYKVVQVLQDDEMSVGQFSGFFKTLWVQVSEVFTRPALVLKFILKVFLKRSKHGFKILKEKFRSSFKMPSLIHFKPTNIQRQFPKMSINGL